MKKKITTLILAVLLVIVLCAGTLTFAACDKEEEVIETKFMIATGSSSLMGLPADLLAIAIDFKNSHIILRSDGTLTLRLAVVHDITSKITDISNIFKINIAEILEGVTIDDGMKAYLTSLFPGFDLTQFEESATLINNSLGLKFVLDYSSEGFRALQEALAQDKLPSEDLSIFNGLAIELNTKYVLRNEIDSEGKVRTGVYVGTHHPDTNPFLLMRLSRIGEQDCLEFWIDFIQLHIVAKTPDPKVA